MDTDILGGIQMGYHTILTMTGVSKKSQLNNYAFDPNQVVECANDLDLSQFE